MFQPPLPHANCFRPQEELVNRKVSACVFKIAQIYIWINHPPASYPVALQVKLTLLRVLTVFKVVSFVLLEGEPCVLTVAEISLVHTSCYGQTDVEINFIFVASITQYNNNYISYLILVIQVMRASIEKQRILETIDPRGQLQRSCNRAATDPFDFLTKCPQEQKLKLKENAEKKKAHFTACSTNFSLAGLLR